MVQMAIDQIGASYGWAKTWSDAPGEWRHLNWKPGVWLLLRRGSRGPQVSWVQTRLRLKGFMSLQVDGIFGPATETAVRTFQTRNHLQADGTVGPLTWGALAR